MKHEISVQKIAKLARLTLNEGESERLYKELCAMIDFAGRLPAELPPEENEVESVFRDDIPSEGLSRDELTENAPDAADGYFRVPRAVKGD